MSGSTCRRAVRFAAIAGCIAGALALGACSGSDTSSGPASTPAPADPARYRAAADATCVEHARAVSAIHARLGPAEWGPSMGAYDAARAEEASRQTLRIRSVIPPPELEELHFSLIRAHADYADAYAAAAERSAAGDEAGWRSANARRDEFGNGLRATARTLGLTACARELPRRPSAPRRAGGSDNRNA